MTSKDNRSEKSNELRRRAEEITQGDSSLMPEDLDTRSPEEVRRILHELRVHQIELEVQNEELREAQRKLSAEQRRYFDFYDLAPVGYLTLSEKGLIVEANFTGAIMLGMNRGALINQPLSPFILSEDQNSYYLHRKQLIATGKPQTYELRMVKKDKTIFWAHLVATTDQDKNGKQVCRIVLSDITARKFRDHYGEFATLLVTQTHTADGFRQCLATLTASLQKWSGCEAVGIRLQRGEDYPYFETRGFPPAFVEAESQLCAYRANGELLLDAAGHPVLECMCGNILRNRFDPSKPFFTSQGSFWSNNTTNLLASTSEADRQARTRNRCNGEGYESVALIPLRDGNKTFGLLQFNDHRPDRFNPELITHFERMADVLSIALSRRQAWELLHENEDRFRSIVENATAGYFFIDGEGLFHVVNSAWLHLHKYDAPEEIVGLHFSATQTDQDMALANENVKLLLSGNEIASGESTRRCKDGSVGWHTYTVAPVRLGGKVIGLEGFIIDTTELRRVEQSLQESHEAMKRILDSINANIYIADMQTHELLFVNEYGLNLFGLDIVGRKCWEIFQAQDKPCSFCTNDKLLTQDGKPAGPYYREFRNLVTQKWYDITDRAIPWHDGHLVRLEVAMDITEKKQSQEALRVSQSHRLEEQQAANARLRAQSEHLELQVEQRTRELQETQKQFLHAEKLSAIGKLSASIAHEFNNPLQGILSILKGLKKRALLEEEDRELLDAAIEESHRIKSLIHNLQDFHRPTSGKKWLVDIHTILNLILLMLKSDFNAKRIKVELNFSPDLPQIPAVPDQLKQVFLNLLSNASDACQLPGGVINISTRQAGDRVAVAIRDSGVGIKHEHIDLIFQPFYTTKPEVKGTGLGLSVSYGIVQSHGGEILVESQPGEGSTFTVFLPISKTALADTATADSESTPE